MEPDEKIIDIFAWPSWITDRNLKTIGAGVLNLSIKKKTAKREKGKEINFDKHRKTFLRNALILLFST